ncbi:MAG: hypothetical protein ABI199_05820 [Bacteroidia bacterium]
MVEYLMILIGYGIVIFLCYVFSKMLYYLITKFGFNANNKIVFKYLFWGITIIILVGYTILGILNY